MAVLKSLNPDDYNYTTVLLHPGKSLLFVGTDHGLVEVWDLSTYSKRAELRYLILNEFGEKIPIKDRVVILAAPATFDYVYAFMGTAAYCIDVNLLTIVEKIPISEEVISGNISQVRGEISVITTTGYLSRWSPKFVERLNSLYFTFQPRYGHLLHDWDESRVILICPDGKLLLANLEGEQYTVELTYDKSSDLLDGIWFDRNQNYQAVITSSGSINIYDSKSFVPEIDDSHLLRFGKIQAEDAIRKFVANSDTGEESRNYIVDFRLERQSRDRYVAEVEQLDDEESHYSGTIEENSKTIHYAMEDMKTENLDQKTTAYKVIEKLAKKHDVDPRFLFFARKLNVKSTQLIQIARYYEFESYRRQRRIYQLLIISVLFMLFNLIFAEFFIYTIPTLIFLVFQLLIPAGFLLYWGNINAVAIPKVMDYRAIRIFCWFVLVSVPILIYFNSFQSVFPLPV